MAIRRISPKSAERPMLPYGGVYGPGAEFEAEVVVHDFIAEITDPKQAPSYDRELSEGPYCMFVFRVKHDGNVLFLRAHQRTGDGSGSQAVPWLKAMGVTVSPEGDFDDKEPIGKKCLLDVKPPRTLPDGSKRGGDVKRVIGL